MSVFSEGRVAIVTGAALGIGRAACRKFAELGMSVCLVDLPGDDLDEALDSVTSSASGSNAKIMAHPIDVADPAQLKALQSKVATQFGDVNVLMNNAVTRFGRDKPVDITQWRRAMDVNFWAVVEGCQIFMPAMLASDAPSRIINVGSKQGITNPPGNVIYNVSKSAVKTYTEALQHELRSNEENAGGTSVSAHLLVPGWTTTGKSEHKDGAWLPEQVVEMMIDAVNADTFYIMCPDNEVTTDMDNRRVMWAAGDITEKRPPLSR
jgi:NAD(P)-dependent dehydrogenase (short-subunit alcohol dehydrogenase family)